MASSNRIRRRRFLAGLGAGTAALTGVRLGASDAASAHVSHGGQPPLPRRGTRQTPTSQLTYNPELKAHGQDFEKQVWQVADNVYSAVGYGMANTMMVVGTDGIIIVDTLDCIESAEETLAAFRRITDKPVKAVIYTHYHQDHVSGAMAYLDAEQRGRTADVYGHERLQANWVQSNGALGPITGARGGYMYGRHLPVGDEGYLNDGLGPDSRFGQIGYIPPNQTFADTLDVTIAGVKLHLVYVPSETTDEIAIYLPDQAIMFTAETINPTFPNCYTIRGTQYRDARTWYRSIDRLRTYDVAAMVPSHGNPVEGTERVHFVMTAYRDIIQYVYDQTLQLINRGYNPDEIAEAIELPEHLASIRPYGREYYGTVKHVVRGIYSGELGWFNADPANLNPLPPKERARRYVELAGGSDVMLDKLRDAVEQEDWRWAADMATWLIRAEPELQEAKQLKAHALRQMGYETINAPWRNFYLEGALELEGKIPSEPWFTAPSSQVLRNLPVQASLLNFTTYLDAQKALRAHLTVGFEFPDTGERYAIEIRRGVAELHDRKLPEHVPAWIRVDTETFYELIAREVSPRELAELVLTGKLSVQGEVGPIGEVGLVAAFLSYFTPPSLNTPALVDR